MNKKTSYIPICSICTFFARCGIIWVYIGRFPAHRLRRTGYHTPAGGAEMDKKVKFNTFQNDKNIDATLFQYGWEQCAPLHSFGPAKRNHYLFHYVFSGKGTLDSTDSSGIAKIYHLEASQGFLICPGQVTTYYADEHLPWEYAWVEFDGVRALEFMEMAGLNFDQPVYRIRKKEYASLIKDEIMNIIDNPYSSPINQIGHMYLFFDALIRSSATRRLLPVGNLKDFYVKEVISFIESNYSYAITVEDIASYCNLNRNYLGKLFKDSTGQTVQHFLIYYRMSVNEIGKLCGYQNQLHFSRAFKNIFGVSPDNWRKTNKSF